MKKRLICLLLILSMTFSLAACDFIFPIGPGPNDGPGPDGEKPGPDDGEEEITGNENIINVYLIAGQSNAVGYGMDTGKVIENSDERFSNGFENVLYYGEQERWNGGMLDEGFQPLTIGMGVAADRSGAEIGIASAIADNGGMNAIIKCAWGATHLYPDTQYDVSLKQGTWTSPSYIAKHGIDLDKAPMVGNMYRRFEDTVREAIDLLIADGYTPVIKGIWWMQGEAEMFTLDMASEYRELFETLITDMRALVGEITGYDCSTTPFICGLPKWNTKNSAAPTYQGMVRTAMTTVADELVNVGYVDCMPLNQHDDWHFDAAGQKYLGEEFVAGIEGFEFDETFTTKLSVNNKIELLPAEKGMQFRADLTSYSSADKYEGGFIIVPTDALAGINGDYIAALDSADVEYKKLPAEIKLDKGEGDYSDIYFVGKLTDIAYADLNTSYTAIAYLKDAYGSYLYSSKSVADSIARLASEELYKEGADIDALIKIVNAGINYINGVPEESSENDSELEIIADNVELIYSEAARPQRLVVSNSVGVDYFVRFSSVNPDIVSVDSEGNLQALKRGTATIVIECAGKTKRVEVNVDYPAMDGVSFDGVISEGEYVGDVITAANANISVSFSGMIKDGKLYLGFEIVHGQWSTRQGNWWDNDNIEFRLTDGEVHTVVFYDGVPEYSANIFCGMSKTEEIDGKLVTVVEVCVDDVYDAEAIKVGFNGKCFGWLGAIWNEELNLAYVTDQGIVSEKSFNAGDITLDGVFSEDIYTENVKNSVISANANGAKVDIIGTLTDKGVVFGVTVNHTKPVNENTALPNDWFTFMNIEFHFNGSGTQFIAISHNRNSLGQIFTYCNTVSEGEGYISTFEIFIPYQAIGSNVPESIKFTARGWFETGWCDLLNSSWDATHVVTSEGISPIK